MCRNIRTLYHLDPPCTDEEVVAATLQFVRKVSGFTKPSQRNEAAFERAVEAISKNVSQFFSELEVSTPPRDRAVLEERARRRAQERRDTERRDTDRRSTERRHPESRTRARPSQTRPTGEPEA